LTVNVSSAEGKSVRSLKKRNQILDAAAAVFREKGYAQATLSDIATKAGTQAGSLYYHFESREHLVEEVLAVAMLQTTERVTFALGRMESSASTAEKMRVGLREHLLQILSHNDYSAAYDKIIDQVPGHVREKFVQYPREYANIWRSIILEGQRKGELRSDLDPTLLRLQLLGSAIWSSNWFDPERSKSPEEIADQMVECFVNGAAPRV
jgi:AcrR family transcriptional regulator